MQMNQALFMLNGRSGYVLQPPIMRDDNFDPFDRHTLRGLESVTLQIEVRVWSSILVEIPTRIVKQGKFSLNGTFPTSPTAILSLGVGVRENVRSPRGYKNV